MDKPVPNCTTGGLVLPRWSHLFGVEPEYDLCEDSSGGSDDCDELDEFVFLPKSRPNQPSNAPAEADLRTVSPSHPHGTGAPLLTRERD